LVEILQQTPLTVTGAPPSALIFPPLVAVVWATFETVAVVNEGTVLLASVVKVSWFPYPVPTLFVA
jgi:hypothetical protein